MRFKSVMQFQRGRTMDTTKAETWKPIPDFPGYEVSDHGRVKSYRKQVGFGDWEIADEPQRILRTSVTASGYLGVQLRHDGHTHYLRIHQLVMWAFVGPQPDDLTVCHNDGDPSNNHLDNLRYDTLSNNVREAVWHGSRQFSPSEIVEIRRKRCAGLTTVSLAETYNTSSSTISSICTGQTYKIIGGPRTKRHHCKLSPDDIQAIRQHRSNGMSLSIIAKDFGVSESHISLITRGLRRKQPAPAAAGGNGGKE